MANGSKFRINRYNWLGQKLLAQHQYRDIVRLHQFVAANEFLELQSNSTNNNSNSDSCSVSRPRWPISEHLIYVNSLAMMKTSTHLDEVIFALQRLNFDKSRPYFLLLCQCLLYSGNYESVVALCKQVINKEIDSVDIKRDDSSIDKSLIELDVSISSTTTTTNNDRPQHSKDANDDLQWTLPEAIQESSEFKRVLANIGRNKLINEPRLWLIFGTCLEYQQQYKSAHFAFEVAAKLAAGSSSGLETSADRRGKAQFEIPATASYFYAPYISYAERFVNNKAEHRGAIQVLTQICAQLPPNYLLNPLLALLLSSQSNANQSNFDKASDIIKSLEIHSASNRNPSMGYNQLALRCSQKLAADLNWQVPSIMREDHLLEIGDESRSCLRYLLAKSYIVLNNLVQNSGKNPQLYKCFLAKQENRHRTSTDGVDCAAANNAELNDTIDKLMLTLCNSTTSCWSSAALWNNLGLCYLIKRRFIACLSCLQKALELNPLDWRLNYNMALACAHVNLFSKAFVCLLAARNQYLKSQRPKQARINPLITSLLAVCYDYSNEVNEARRLHIEATRPLEPDGSKSNSVSVMSLLNYLIFLNKELDQNADKEYSKVIVYLLDLLEQCWLQRDQHDPQFNASLLDVARQIGERVTINVGKPTRAVKSYAWTKHAQDDTRNLHIDSVGVQNQN